MKELSVEEKAKRFDEVFGIASCKHKFSSNISEVRLAEEMFPELKESEDERIRKAIINVFATHKDYEIFFGVSVEDILAWLEKQDKSSSKVHYWTEEEIEPIINDYLRGAEHYGGMIGRLRCLKPKSLDKQGENNMGISEATKQELKDNLDKALEQETPESWNEFLDEQKPVDKVEPKFHEGDWIVFNEHTFYIKEVAVSFYKTISKDDIAYNYDWCIDKMARLWTVQDAKEGDVLAADPIEGIERFSSSFIAIYKERNGEDFDSYCFVGFDGKFCKGEIGHSTDRIHPATEEQRNQLEKAMHEAGYTFDFDKKELKKISQEYPLTPNECINPSWSEEDEENLNWFDKFFRAESVFNEGKDIPQDRYLWFKNLKDRVQPQLKQEWSKEDEKMIGNIRKIIAQDAFYNDAVDVNGELCEKMYIDADNWLKLLKDKIQPNSIWKPSNEQMHELANACCGKVWNLDYLNSLYQDLKKLKEGQL